jgi:hypothetical protein
MGYQTTAGSVSSISSGGEYDSPDLGSNSTYIVQSAAEAAAAALSAAQAATSAASAAASYDSFDDRYLGAKAVDPTLDNDGNALLTGALYFSTVSNVMKAYNGTIWIVVYSAPDAYLLATSNLSDLTNIATARTNLGISATGADTTYAYRANNLSDLASASTARTNLGLGSAAVASTTDFDAAGSAIAMSIALG